MTGNLHCAARGSPQRPERHGGATRSGPSATESNGLVGNLQLSAQQEDDLVNFLKILTDGYTKSNPVSREKGL